MKLNKKWFTFLEMIFALLVAMIVLTGIYSLATNAMKNYNNFRIQRYVIEENDKFLRALGWLRFWMWINYLDQNPVDHPKFSDLKINFPDNKTISFEAVDPNGEKVNDIKFINTEWKEIYTYNQDVITVKEFEVVPLDKDVHRWWVRVHVKIGASGKYDPDTWKINRRVSKMFWNTEYWLDYYITYTFRNAIPPEE